MNPVIVMKDGEYVLNDTQDGWKDSDVFDFIALKRSISEYIDSLNLEPGNRIPTESKLCRKFGISHYQVRKVLAELTAERNWITIQGSGTYIPGALERRPRERTIAVVRSYQHDMITQLREAHSLALENKYQFLLFGIDHAEVIAEQECLEHLLTRRLHALVIDPHPGNPIIRETLDRFIAQGTRVVLLNGSRELRERYPTYSFNYQRAGYMALVQLMRQNVKKAIHITPYNSIAWQHAEFQRGVDEASADFSFPVEHMAGKMLLDVRNFKWSWQPQDFVLPMEENCGYIDDNDPFEASYVHMRLQEAGLRNAPVISVYHTNVPAAYTTLCFNTNERMKWIVNELIHNAGNLPHEQRFNPILTPPPESPEPYRILWG